MCWASKAQEVGQRVMGPWNREEDSMFRRQVDVAIKNRWNSSLKRKFDVESYDHDVGRSCPLLPLKKRRANYMSSDLALLEKGNIAAAGETTDSDAVAAIKTLISHSRCPNTNAEEYKKQNTESRKLVVLDAISSKSAKNNASVSSSENTNIRPEELAVLSNMVSRSSRSSTNNGNAEFWPSRRTDKANLWSSNCGAVEIHEDQEDPCTLLTLALPGSCPPEISHQQSRLDQGTNSLRTESTAAIQAETATVLKEMVEKEIGNYISSEMIWETIRESIEKEIASAIMNYMSSGMFRESAQIKMIGTVIWAAAAEEDDADKNPRSPSNQDKASMIKWMLRKEVMSCMTAEMVKGEIRGCVREMLKLSCSSYLENTNNVVVDPFRNRSGLQ